MIPRLDEQVPLNWLYSEFLGKIRTSGFRGQIQDDLGTRLITATDNSIYQILPQAVVYPRDQQDIVTLLKIATEEPFKEIQFSPRGGGTGTNGQSLSSGIVVDCSRHMNQILELNLEEGWVLVQPGVVLDQLNEFLRPHKVFFAPNLSPSNRATLGGMINTDACGQGSRVHGKTSNHILALSCVLSDGTLWDAEPLATEPLELVKERTDMVGLIHQQVDGIVTRKQDLIKEVFPKLSRFLTGYNLAKVYENETGTFNLNYLLSGSEGTLAFITQAKLKITPMPKFKQLIVMKYESFDHALSDAEILVNADPESIETVDEKILTLAREDEIFLQVKDFIQDEGDRPTRAINLVEFTGDQLEPITAKINAFRQAMEQPDQHTGHATGYYLTDKPEEIKSLWNLRKKGVGLLGNTKGKRKPIPFIEDTAVPPEHLASYIRELKALLDGYGLEYAMFGHVDVGCLHVRPALDMQNPLEESWVREISDKVVAMVRKYGGVMWAEHGKGFRSEYTPQFFGEELYADLRRIKEAFDPFNKLNPGKIVAPLSMENKLVKVEAPLRGHYDRQIKPEFQITYETSISCNGNGACFNYDPNDVMCPSSKITRDRIHSPKGRAGLMREWLRRLSLTPAVPVWGGIPGKWIGRFFNTFQKNRDYDYSHEVYDAMAGCLACKACATQCPVHVDVPSFRSRFLDAYHTRYLRPLKDYFIASMEYIGVFASRFPLLVNAILKSQPVQWLFRNMIGLVDLPKFSRIPLSTGIRQRNIPEFRIDQLKQLSPAQKAKSVILLQDAFTSFYESNLVLDIYDFLSFLGYQVYIAPYHPNGKPLHVKGFLSKFKDIAHENSLLLEQIAVCGIPMIGVDPSVVLTYRDEYPELLEKPMKFEVQLIQEWLVTQKEQLRKFKAKTESEYQLLGHCMEKTGALLSQKQWQEVFAMFGLKLKPLSVGCCGMAGTYGHEANHAEESRGIYELSWAKHIPDNPLQRERVVVTGFSCRSQVERFRHFNPNHPIQVIFRELK
ncbi:MAG: FAD-binding oxidoreductase [SAR324 cluster bacterium]|nr:FAD-binding oxidoreductase [SAR324 cluster bacterium]